MSFTPAAALAPQQVTAGIRATYAAFIASGFAFASWASRIPQVRDRSRLSPADLGLVLLAIAAGSLIALPLAGHRRSPVRLARAQRSWPSCWPSAWSCVAVGYLIGVLPVVVGLFLVGFGNGAWDVAMNVQGATVERHLGRAIMPPLPRRLQRRHRRRCARSAP